MKKRHPILPATIIDQIKLWELEKKRLAVFEGVLYHDFASLSEFDMASRFATEIHGLLLALPKTRSLVVTPDAHILVKAYMKTLSSRP